MKVILIKNVPKLGQQWDVKDVALGYARNFLIPKGFAEEASPKALEELEARKATETKSAEANLLKMEELVGKLEGQIVEIKAKASEEGTLYAAISSTKVLAALKDKGFNIAKSQIELGHIKEIGDHEIIINLDHGLEARITLTVNPE